MSDASQQHPERKRTGWRIALVLLILLLMYVLSPPCVMELAGVQSYVDYCAWMHWPLVKLAHSSELVRNISGSYFELFPSDYWYAWYLGSETLDQSGGMGAIQDIRPIP